MGNLKLALFLAFKSIIKGSRWAPFLIVLVMAFSFANLIIAPSILAGVTATLDEQQVNSLFANIIIDPEEDKYYLDHAGQIESMVGQVPGVVGVSAHLNSNAFIEYQWREKESSSDRGKSGNWSVVGIDPSQEVNTTTIREHIIEGSYLDSNDRDKIVLGIEIAGNEGAQSSSFRTLGGVQIGDEVRLTYPNGTQREYEVKGIFRAREITADRSAFVTRKEMVSVLGRQVFHDRASQILVKIKQVGDEGRFIKEFEALGINGEIRGWKEYGWLGSIVSSFDIVASLINAIGLVVATIVMFIVIYINVINKKRQIGVLRAIGIKRDVIVTSYIFQSLFYAISGVILGWLLIHFGLEPYFISYPLDLPLGLVSLVIEPLTVQKAIWGLILAAVFAGFIPVLLFIRQSIINSIWGN